MLTDVLAHQMHKYHSAILSLMLVYSTLGALDH